MAKTSPMDLIVQTIRGLSGEELIEVVALATALLAISDEAKREDERMQVEQLQRRKNGSVPGARGHIEYKTINGCGPYLYWRYWDGSIRRSRYLGKSSRQI